MVEATRTTWRERIDAIGLRQDRVAADVGETTQNLNRYVNGRRAMPDGLARRLDAYLSRFERARLEALDQLGREAPAS